MDEKIIKQCELIAKHTPLSQSSVTNACKLIARDYGISMERATEVFGSLYNVPGIVNIETASQSAIYMYKRELVRISEKINSSHSKDESIRETNTLISCAKDLIEELEKL